MSNVELAWAAGFFEGEGSVFPTKHRSYKYLLSLDQTDGLELVTRFLNAVGYGTIHGPYTTKSGRLRWRWDVQKHSLDVMLLLEPYLGEHSLKVKRWKELMSDKFSEHS